MPTENIREKKLIDHFELFDINLNGYIEQDDLKLFVTRICSAAGVAPSAPKGKACLGQGLQLWEALQKALDKDGDQRISRDEFVSAMDLDAVVRAAVELGAALFDVVDTDGDGRITLEEWLQMDMQAGVARAASLKGFRYIDQDGDGYVTKDEYSKGVEEFHRSSEPAVP